VKSDKDSIICWWSGGITSAVACKLSIDKYSQDRCVVIMLDTQNEHEDTYRFKDDCEKWYGLPIELLGSNKFKNPKETWYHFKSLNTANGAICSSYLKREVRKKWESHNEYKHQVFGFEYSKKEINRAKALEMNYPKTNPLFPLIEAKMDKEDCIRYVREAGLKIPKAYDLGFVNNNCLKTGCVQGGIGYWKKIQKDRPDLFKEMARIEHELTDLKGKPVTMLKDQSKAAKDSGIDLVFLLKHPSYPEHKTIDDMGSKAVRPLAECNGFCGTNELNERNDTEKEINWEDSQALFDWG